MSIVNGSLQADRMFFQVPGFNAVLYEIPSKLIVFYTAYVNKIARILDDLNSSYRFIVCPDLYQFTYISILFPEKCTEKDLLLKVRIPVESLFKPKRLIMELTHEVAHYVGKSVRNRKNRYELELDILSKELFEYLFENDDKNIIGEVISKLNDKNEFKINVIKKLRESILLYVDDYFENDYDNIEEEYRYHQKFLNNALYKSCREAVMNPIVFESVMNELNLGVSTEEDRQFIFEKALGFKMSIDYNKNSIEHRMKDIIDQLNLLIKESYADFIMKLVLEIDSEEYVLSFFEPTIDKYSNPCEILYKDMIGERICAVLNAAGEDVSSLKLNNRYNDEVTQTKLNQFIDLLKFFNNDCKSIKNYKLPAFSKYSIDKVTEYLRNCYESFIENQDDYGEIRNLFQNLVDSNIYSCINKILEFNHQFRDELTTRGSNE